MKIEKIKKVIATMEKLNEKLNMNLDEEIADFKELVTVLEELSASEQEK